MRSRVLALVAIAATAATACTGDTRDAADQTKTAPLDLTSDVSEPTLVGRAIIPSDAFQPGPPSGAFLSPENGVTPPFETQPLPGFSAILSAGEGRYYGMPDNGFGAKTNSSDFLLRLYHIRPDFKTAAGGSGRVEILGFISFRDPDHKIPYPLIRSDRLLTGADLDIESIRRTQSGEYWVGDEFGPFLVHADSTGKLLDAPFSLSQVMSPQNPFLTDTSAWTLRASRGFEALAISPDGARLYPMLEGALRTDPDPRRRVLHEFDLRQRAYTNRSCNYAGDAPTPTAVVADMTALDDTRFLLIERDDEQGATARQKKIYLIDVRRTDAKGYLVKELVVDLLTIRDPHGVSLPARPGEFGVGDPFAFPLQSVEALEYLGDRGLLVASDNNFPFNDGRWTLRDRPDDTELIVIRLPRAP
jgi:hypothetical protein